MSPDVVVVSDDNENVADASELDDVRQKDLADTEDGGGGVGLRSWCWERWGVERMGGARRDLL
jgi:hypothetical protein